MPTNLSFDTLLRRKPLAEALTAAGYPVAAASLATMATRGGGPLYRKFGRVALYRWGDALAWAEARISSPRCSTSEDDVLQASKKTSVTDDETSSPAIPAAAVVPLCTTLAGSGAEQEREILVPTSRV